MNEFETYGRFVALHALTGSHNYNLNTANSDEDWKAFVVPTFHDLYGGEFFSHAVTSETVDYTVHDVRRLAELLWKANPNFVEVLYSTKRTYSTGLYFLYEQRWRWATMNLPAFGNACYGMHTQKMNELFKGTSTTKELVEKHGYDTKQACHALRLLYLMDNVVHQLEETGQDSNLLFWFHEFDPRRVFLLELKAGCVSLEDFQERVMRWKHERLEYTTNALRSRVPNDGSHQELKYLVKQFVRNNLEM